MALSSLNTCFSHANKRCQGMQEQAPLIVRDILDQRRQIWRITPQEYAIRATPQVHRTARLLYQNGFPKHPLAVWVASPKRSGNHPLVTSSQWLESPTLHGRFAGTRFLIYPPPWLVLGPLWQLGPFQGRMLRASRPPAARPVSTGRYPRSDGREGNRSLSS